MPKKQKAAQEERENIVPETSAVEPEILEPDSENNALLKKIEELESEVKKSNDLLLRTAAEFDNFKKRTQREKDASVAFIRAQTVKALLSSYDSLDRALAADSSSPDYAKGLELSLKQLMDGFSKLGLEEIKCEGETFDPECQEAVMHVEDESAGESVVLEVLQKGYKIGETVLRPAMVKVAN